MEIIVNYEIINGADKFGTNERSSSKIGYCSVTESCEVYQQGNCLALNACPNARVESEIGFTSRAKKNFTWLKERKDLVMNVEKRTVPKKMAKIPGYVFFNYGQWYNGYQNSESLLYKYRLRPSYCKYRETRYIKEEDFTIEFIKSVLTEPLSELKDYDLNNFKNKTISQIESNLLDTFPELYYQIKNDYPNVLNELSYIGREALLNTIPYGTEFEYSDYKIVVKNNTIEIQDLSKNKISLFNSQLNLQKNKRFNCISEISDEDTIVIQNDNQWNRRTKFVN